MKRLVCIAFMMCFSVGALAAAPTALCVNHWCLSPQAFQLLYQAEQRHATTSVSEADYKQQLVDVRLLANYARQQGFESPQTPYNVGFGPAIERQREAYSLFHGQLVKPFTEYIKAHLDKKGLNAYLLSPIHAKGMDIDAALKADSRRTIGMTPEQLDAAKSIVLVRYQFPGAPEQTFTLAELYLQQNVQGRLALQQRGSQFIRAQVRQQVMKRYFYWWLHRKSGWQPDAIAAVKQALVDRQLNNAWLEQQGLVHIVHDNRNVRLEKAAKQVTDEQIADWYNNHKADFLVPKSVHAFHLACNSRQACEKGRKAMINGIDPSEVMLRYADPAFQKGSVDLGVLTRKNDGMQWLTNAAMLQEEGEYSVPLRAPDGHWEVVWVKDAQSTYLPVDSSSVRYQASRAIARIQLLEAHQALMQRLRQQADIEVN